MEGVEGGVLTLSRLAAFVRSLSFCFATADQDPALPGSGANAGLVADPVQSLSQRSFRSFGCRMLSLLASVPTFVAIGT